jgi:hypothetical protein
MQEARCNGDVLASQKSATNALNHVFKTLGVRLKSRAMGSKDVAGGQQDGIKRPRVYSYGGWYIKRSPRSEILSVTGPPRADLMGQLLKLRVEGSTELKARISDQLKVYLGGVHLTWPELVK